MSQTVIMDKKGAIMIVAIFIITVERYSILMCLFDFIFTVCGSSCFLYFFRNKVTLVSQIFTWVFAM